MEDKEKEKLEQELMFLKESFDTEVITKEEYDKAKERIERKLKEFERKNSNKPVKKEKQGEVTMSAPKGANDEIIAVPGPKEEIEIIAEPKEEKKMEKQEPQAVEAPVLAKIPEPAKRESHDGAERGVEPKAPEEEIKIGKWLWLLLIIAVVGGIYYFYFTGSGTGGIAPDNEPVAAPENINSKVIVLSSGKCFNCDTGRVKDIIKSWFPSLIIEERVYESDEGKLLADEMGLRLLPAYIFDENVTKYGRFWELKQIFDKIGERYVLSDEAGGGKLYFARENMPNKLTLFAIQSDSNSRRAIKNAEEFIGKSGGKVIFEVIDLNNDLAKSLSIKTAPTFLINNHIKLTGVQSANSIKENFCKLNNLNICSLELSNSLKLE